MHGLFLTDGRWSAEQLKCAIPIPITIDRAGGVVIGDMDAVQSGK